MTIRKKIIHYLKTQKTLLYIKLRNVVQRRTEKNKIFVGHNLNKEKGKIKYIVLRYDAIMLGIMTGARLFVLQYMYFKKCGLIPLVDIEFADTLEDESPQARRSNMWDACFCQPISVEKAYELESIRVTTRNERFYDEEDCLLLNGDENDFEIHIVKDDWRSYYKNVYENSKEWLAFQPEVLRYVDEYLDSRIDESDRVLGVFLREEFSSDIYDRVNDDLKKIYDKHPKVPNLNDTIVIIKEKMKEWNCNKLLVSTLFQDTIDRLKSEFGDALLYSERERESIDSWINYDMEIKTFKEIRPNPIKMAQQYTAECIALSKCNCLIAAASGGTVGTLMLNGGKYEELMILGQGDY